MKYDDRGLYLLGLDIAKFKRKDLLRVLELAAVMSQYNKLYGFVKKEFNETS